MMYTLLAQAQPQGGSLTSTLLMVGLMFLVFWLLVWRPQSKEQERHQNFINSLKKGDEVVTADGLIGTVAEVDDKIIVLKIARNTKIEVLRDKIRQTKAQALTQGQPDEEEQSGGDEGGDEDDDDDDKEKGTEW